jgi:hypothetical protein
VLIVAGLYNEYREEYHAKPEIEITTKNKSPKVKLVLNNYEQRLDRGSINSSIIVGKNNNGEQIAIMQHDSHTIWQSQVQDPLNALIIPAEETFHALLRPGTEKIILSSAENDWTEEDFTAMAEAAIIIEEALAAAMVEKLFYNILSEEERSAWFEKIKIFLVQRAEMEKYRLIPRALDRFKDLSMAEILSLYKNEPEKTALMLE